MSAFSLQPAAFKGEDVATAKAPPAGPWLDARMMTHASIQLRRGATLVVLLFIVAIAGPAFGQAPGDAWKAADPTYAISLPRDHGAHPDARIEWWYYTGNLVDTGGRRFGYQLTFFRVGVVAQPTNPSRWAVRDVYMTDFAITDVEKGAHVSADRLNRAGPGWAGASVESYRVWNEDWEVALGPGGQHRLRAKDARIEIDLALAPGKPPVFHGERGYSRKGPTPGNASHYYSLTRMPTTGTVVIDGRRFEVSGDSWMDHEWGTSFLEPGQAGWDWFSLQFQDGRELMLFQLRGTDGETSAFTSGTLVQVSGETRHLGAGEFSLRPGRTWTSPGSGGRYPVEWAISVPSLGLQGRVQAVFAGQELRTAASSGVTYWEGMVDFAGTEGGNRPVRGRGYLEMTGYVGRPMCEVFR